MTRINRRLTALGAYIFAGGFTLGVRQHFKVLAHLEDGQFGAETARQNLKIPVHDDPATWPLHEFDNVDFLYANPPCAPWSSAGQRIDRPHWSVDPRTGCWRRTAELVWQLRPIVAAIESVRPIYTKGRELISQIAAEGRRQGYRAIAVLEDAQDCGIPQRRPRFVLVLTRCIYRASPTGYDDPPTVSEILREVKRLRLPSERHRKTQLAPSIKNVLPTLEQGINGQRAHKLLFPNAAKDGRGKIPGRPSFLTCRLHPRETAPAKTGGCHWVHPTEDRYVSVAETAALCGFPPDYTFVEKHGDAYNQLSKGVLPPVAEHLAKDVAATIRRNKPVTSLSPLEIRIERKEIHVTEIDL